LLVVSVVTGLLVVYTSGGLPNWDPSITRSQYLIAQARAVLHYIQVVIVPVNQTLDPTVYFNETPWHPLELSGIALVLSLVVVAVACHKKHAPISFGIWWFFATLMVESSFFPISDPIVEHRMYLPMAGLSISLAYVVFLVLRHTTARVRIATLLCLVVVLIAVSIRRNMDWKTDVSLWRAEMQQNPESNRVLNNLGYTYFEAGQIDSAYKYISKSQEFDPGTCFGLNGMGEVLMKKGDTTRALFYFKTAARRCNFFYSYNNLAYHYYKTHDLEQAQSYISKSFEVVEYFKTTYIQYLIFKKMNKPAEAQHFLQKARLMNPDYDYATMYPESSN
jgi:hypothetical protein